jgi:hypothetical protein
MTHASCRGSIAERRSGVTLLEVMISVGVMAIGLMGMASLIPLGKLELAEGNRLDNTSTLGRAAFRDITIRGYLRPENWLDPVTGRNVIVPEGTANPYTASSASSTYRRFPAGGAIVGPPFAPIVIDPLMVAPRMFDSTSDETAHRTNCRSFPYSANLPGAQGGWPEGSVPKLARATLRAYPAYAGSPAGRDLEFTMQHPVAARFFRSNDDLTIDIPTDRVRRPTQEFALSSVTSLSLRPHDGVSVERPVNQAAYRMYRGDYSWFLVAEPSMAEAYDPAPQQVPMVGGPNGSLYTTRQHRVWAVICEKRDLRSTAGMNLDEDRVTGERMAWVDFIDRNTARLRVHDTDRATAMRLLDLKNNQWFAAMARYPHPVLGQRLQMEWYRIVNVADQVQSVKDDEGNDTPTWYREATIAGRDFSSLGFEFEDASTFNYPDVTAVARAADNVGNPEPLTAWGVIIPGVRGVYEKSVYVDRPSSWSLD